MNGLLGQEASLDPGAAALLVLGGVVSGIFNILAGGGSLLTVPLLVWLGVPAGVANGTNRLSIWVQSAAATVSFHRQGQVPWKEIPSVALPVLLGAGLGALLAVQMSDLQFRRLFGLLSVGAGLLLLVDTKRWLRSVGSASRRRRWTFATLMAVGLYGGLVQAGVGILFLAALVGVAGRDLLSATVLKVVLIGLYTPVVLGVFQASNQVWWPQALVLSAGSWVGASLGARLAVKTRGAAVRPLVAVVVVAAAATMIWGGAEPERRTLDDAEPQSFFSE